MKLRNYTAFYIIAFVLGYLLVDYEFGSVEFVMIIGAVLVNIVNMIDFQATS